ncbi:transposase [Rhodoplanes sp. SY1]|uniref:transposase n=1 Tax=Rhodoplanes sp. SY1 TaxID=3166646 RepID=UPI0038B42C19
MQLDCPGVHDGLLSAAERKMGWLMSEVTSENLPYRTRFFVELTCWEADRVRDGIWDYAIESLGGRYGLLIVHETGFLKKDDHSIRVARQCSGTAGRIENRLIAVPGLNKPGRHALIERGLYLRKEKGQRYRSATGGLGAARRSGQDQP